MKEKWNINNQPKYESDNLIPNLIGSPWSGHRNFAYDLVCFLNPNLIVELGTHYGCSFFSFAQAIKDNSLNSKLVAVDTWEGDNHAGFYDDQVFNVVTKTVNEIYSDVKITLNRDTFDNTLDIVEDNSIDLLHIDGFHSYEAVKHDFYSWLPKLKDNGVVLLHDIAEYTGYGSADFWKELKSQYNYFEFSHSWGLGVVFPKSNLIYEKLVHENLEEKIGYYEYKARYELEYLKSTELDKVALDRLDAINKMEKIIIDKEKSVIAQGRLLIEREEAMEKMEGMINDKQETVTAQERLLIEREEAMEKMESMINDKQETVIAQERLLIERAEAMEKMEQIIEDQKQIINTKEEQFKQILNKSIEQEQIILSSEKDLENVKSEKNSIAIELESIKTKYFKIKKWLFFLKK
ncbi:class I SAM-dependent methyltransferase [Psychrobacillus sp. FSL H8-0510]|uniref:class I SAM-dependent methyltransferase n=1 Tax=Psychrobacillus sp. FSL H8-0510 TaxID=2921394 RepID=UPI0030F723D5